MNEVLLSIILGIIQGITEFLPISSSGHLEIAKVMLGSDLLGDDSLLLTVFLHLGTALSTMFVFRDDIWHLVRGALMPDGNQERRYIGYIILSMIPATIVGLFFLDKLELLFGQNLYYIGLALIVTGLLLYVASRARDTDKSVGWLSSLYIGLAQALATVPGISRSGATISTAVILGIDKEKSARFSFLMVLPLIFGKIAKDVLDGGFAQSQLTIEELAFGGLSAFITGIFACRAMIRIVKQNKLHYFAVYCFVVALICFIYQYTHS